ncbi:hypothetical protein GIB67_036543 [Kingdonia uniflora]|uniref:ABC transporter domain-containing protein n=1 Tax=Kingdonia uniflora TaxID=39325 RepID=A0A7J7NVW7_9MAGN|nr:hypothetical protein GIB67_036543 [Kingdonia uniflora]
MYAEADRWSEVKKVRSIMKGKGMQKRCAGSSWIEMDEKVLDFVASDESYHLCIEIYMLLSELSWNQVSLVAGIVVGGLSPLSETLWKEKIDTEFIGDVSAKQTWKDLTVMVILGNGETETVLDGLTGYAEPGSLMALMGPSGSGKLTLLDALFSRLDSNAFLSRSILNGRKIKLSFGTAVNMYVFRMFMCVFSAITQAYMTQDDNLIETLKVWETISYSARLRLLDKMPWSEKRALIESTIIEIGHQDCADTVIGNWHLRGVSEGEKRRACISLEILMRPKLVFLDEPTSGLDW